MFKKSIEAAFHVAKKCLIPVGLGLLLLQATGCAVHPAADGSNRKIVTIGGEPVARIQNPVDAHNEAWDDAKRQTKQMLNNHNSRRSRYWHFEGREYDQERITFQNGNLKCDMRIEETSPLVGTAACAEIEWPRNRRQISFKCDVYGDYDGKVEQMDCTSNVRGARSVQMYRDGRWNTPRF